jgi:hypothetical protein
MLQFYRGFWCPKEQAFFRVLVKLQDEAEVAYTRFVSVSVDRPETEAAFRAGLGARWTQRGSRWHSRPSASASLFDDPAVSSALRSVLAGPRVRAMSTLTLDSASIGGALTAYDACPSVNQSADPFARLFPTRVLHVGGGFIGSMHPPTGPGIQRYSGGPWPWSSF